MLVLKRQINCSLNYIKMTLFMCVFFQISRKWHVVSSLDLSIVPENMNCTRKKYELYKKNFFLVQFLFFSRTVHIFSYN